MIEKFIGNEYLIFLKKALSIVALVSVAAVILIISFLTLSLLNNRLEINNYISVNSALKLQLSELRNDFSSCLSDLESHKNIIEVSITDKICYEKQCQNVFLKDIYKKVFKGKEIISLSKDNLKQIFNKPMSSDNSSLVAQ